MRACAKGGKGQCRIWSGLCYADAAPLRRGSPFCHHHTSAPRALRLLRRQTLAGRRREAMHRDELLGACSRGPADQAGAACLTHVAWLLLLSLVSRLVEMTADALSDGSRPRLLRRVHDGVIQRDFARSRDERSRLHGAADTAPSSNIPVQGATCIFDREPSTNVSRKCWWQCARRSGC